jgi:ribosome-binding protein aMBF1 (putative translation factor)
MKPKKPQRLKVEGETGPNLQALLKAVEQGEIAEDAIITPPTPVQDTSKSPWTTERIQQTVQHEVIAHSLGELIEKARRAKGISVIEQAKALKVSRSQVYQLELPTANLEFSTLLRYAHALGYKVEVALIPEDASDGAGERLVAAL